MFSQQKGKVSTWKDDRGFGFIKPDDGREEVFFHRSSLTNSRALPTKNASLTYTLTYDGKRRPRAIDVRFDDEPMSPARIALSVVGTFFIALAVVTFLSDISPLILAAYFIVSGVTFTVYKSDKFRAVRGKRRTREVTIHFLELIGGWPGALVAQWRYRHKNRKRSYQVTYWMIVFTNLAVLTWYCTAGPLW
jgi:uncharacterized membrane protein YsdA (DUF1294 family)/cold shock CspA family protein